MEIYSMLGKSMILYPSMRRLGTMIKHQYPNQLPNNYPEEQQQFARCFARTASLGPLLTPRFARPPLVPPSPPLQPHKLLGDLPRSSPPPDKPHLQILEIQPSHEPRELPYLLPPPPNLPLPLLLVPSMVHLLPLRSLLLQPPVLRFFHRRRKRMVDHTNMLTLHTSGVRPRHNGGKCYTHSVKAPGLSRFNVVLADALRYARVLPFVRLQRALQGTREVGDRGLRGG